MYHTFSIQSSVNGHLGGFYVSATVNSAAMKIKVPYPFSLEFCADKCSGVELLNHMIVLFLVFLRNLHTVFPQWLRQLPFPPTVWFTRDIF